MYYKALQIAFKAHKDQMRKQSCVPYIVHPLRVAGYFQDDLRKTIAILHDVVEDTEIRLLDLMDIFPREVIIAIDHLSRREGEKHFDYIKRAKKNELAREIKIADITDNLSDTLCVVSNSMSSRYRKSLEILIQ